MAQFYSEFKELGKYKTEVEANEAINAWKEITRPNDWKFEIAG